MLDGDPATGWSNAFLKAATALLPAFDGAHARRTGCRSTGDGPRRSTGSRSPSPSTRRTPCPPRSRSAYWDGRRYVPVKGAEIDWATASDAPTAITFDAVRGGRIRLTMTSRHPGEARGALRISRLEAPPR